MQKWRIHPTTISPEVFKIIASKNIGGLIGSNMPSKESIVKLSLGVHIICYLLVSSLVSHSSETYHSREGALQWDQQEARISLQVHNRALCRYFHFWSIFFIISSSILREISPATGDQSTQVTEQSDGQIEELVERVDGRSSMSRHKSLRFKTVSSSIKSQVFTKTRVNISYRLSFHFLQVLHQSSFKDYRSWNITYVWGESASVWRTIFGVEHTRAAGGG